MIQCSKGEKYEMEYDLILDLLSENIINEEEFMHKSTVLDDGFKELKK